MSNFQVICRLRRLNTCSVGLECWILDIQILRAPVNLVSMVYDDMESRTGDSPVTCTRCSRGTSQIRYIPAHRGQKITFDRHRGAGVEHNGPNTELLELRDRCWSGSTFPDHPPCRMLKKQLFQPLSRGRPPHFFAQRAC